MWERKKNRDTEKDSARETQNGGHECSPAPLRSTFASDKKLSSSGRINNPEPPEIAWLRHKSRPFPFYSIPTAM
jgi:hypothetical protein